jgi:hypothetical protein
MIDLMKMLMQWESSTSSMPVATWDGAMLQESSDKYLHLLSLKYTEAIDIKEGKVGGV